MTGDEIRAAAIEKIAEAEYMHWSKNRAEESTWADCHEVWRIRFVEKATRAVDALGDMLPIAIESGLIGRSLRRRTRFVGAWKEATE